MSLILGNNENILQNKYRNKLNQLEKDNERLSESNLILKKDNHRLTEELFYLEQKYETVKEELAIYEKEDKGVIYE